MKENKFLQYGIVCVISSLLLTACSDNSQLSTQLSSLTQTNNQPNPTDNSNSPVVIDTTLDNLTNPAKVGITLPPEPTDEQAKVGLMGVDTNNNQVRDDIEHTIYQAVSLSDPPITANEYQQALDLIKYIQPNNDPNQSIDQHTFYCKYVALSSTLKNKLSMGFLEYLVTDTKERGEAFEKKFINSSSTGEEICN